MNFEEEKAKLLEEKAADDDGSFSLNLEEFKDAMWEIGYQGEGEWRLRLCSVVCGPLSALGCF